MKDVKVLYVGIAFPPKRDPECIQTGRILKYLSKNENIELEVITAKSPVLNMPVDDTLKNFDIRASKVYEKLIFENRYLNFLKSKIGVTSFPDLKASFWKEISEFTNHNSIEKPDIIYTRAYPMSSVLAGYYLSKYFHIPLIVHLSDPWLLSPLHHYSKKEIRRIRQTESEIFNKASAITFTSEKTRMVYVREYPNIEKKSFLQPNVYDDESIIEALPAKQMNDKMRLVYTGGIVGNRNPEAIIEAINQLDESECNKIEFIIAGDADRVNRTLLNELSHSQIKYLGLVPFQKAMELQASAHLLVLFDNVFENKNDAMYLPSKLLDYFVQRTKILAITTPDGTTDQVLSKTRSGVSFGHDQIQELTTFLREALKNFDAKNESFFVNSNVPKEFSASYNAEILNKIILKYA